MATRAARGKFEQIRNLGGRRKTLRDLYDVGPSARRFLPLRRAPGSDLISESNTVHDPHVAMHCALCSLRGLAASQSS
jgi:hypothetical protein